MIWVLGYLGVGVAVMLSMALTGWVTPAHFDDPRDEFADARFALAFLAGMVVWPVLVAGFIVRGLLVVVGGLLIEIGRLVEWLGDQWDNR